MAKVLVVDDDVVLGRLYKSALENEGHEVDMAVDGEEGLQKASESKSPFILTDIMMPRMDGLELLKKIKSQKDTKDIPVIVMTNLNDEENIETARKEGALHFVLKNEQGPQEVVKVIKKLLTDTSSQ